MQWCLTSGVLFCRFQSQDELDCECPCLQCPESFTERQQPPLQRRLWCRERQPEELQQVRWSCCCGSRKNSRNVFCLTESWTFLFTWFCRYSAIHCTSAVPMSSLELQQRREMQRAPTPEPAVKKTGMNGEANLASKPSTKPPKGIMGMFGNKAAPKNQDSGKEVKLEQKEDAPVVWLCVLWWKDSLFIRTCSVFVNVFYMVLSTDLHS